MGRGSPLSAGPRRRALLQAGAAWAAGGAGCARPSGYTGGWVGADAARGHRLRDTQASARAPDVQRRCAALVVGAGIAGLGAARALRRAGVDDVRVFELEDSAGGNSRGHRIDGRDCPLGAHYLPLPGPQAHEVAELLDELGLRRVEHGRVRYDERHLCHSPQERRWTGSAWVEGLLPREAAPAQLRRFAERVAALQRDAGFAIPTPRAAWNGTLARLDGMRFADWLDAEGLDDPALRTYLDYCCRDDYGAGPGVVSAWAGLHYFASRHGFEAEFDDASPRDAVLTWPEGNAWLARRIAQPLGDRLRTGCVALRVAEGRHDVEVDLLDDRTGRIERWTAVQVILALPLHVAARIVTVPDAALAEAAARVPHAPWLVANVLLDAPAADQPGMPIAWDNVMLGARSLGYVDAGHQSLLPMPDARLLTLYWALGDDAAAQRRALLDRPWDDWAARVVAELALAHPDLPAKVRRVDLMRYGHAMAIPAPGVRGLAALRALRERDAGRVQFAHADLSGYSIFEEALYHGTTAGRRAARALRGAAGGSA